MAFKSSSEKWTHSLQVLNTHTPGAMVSCIKCCLLSEFAWTFWWMSFAATLLVCTTAAKHFSWLWHHVFLPCVKLFLQPTKILRFAKATHRWQAGCCPHQAYRFFCEGSTSYVALKRKLSHFVSIPHSSLQLCGVQCLSTSSNVLLGLRDLSWAFTCFLLTPILLHYQVTLFVWCRFSTCGWWQTKSHSFMLNFSHDVLRSECCYYISSRCCWVPFPHCCYSLRTISYTGITGFFELHL